MFERYHVYPEEIGYQLAVIYAVSLPQAKRKWKEFAIDGPHNVIIELASEQCPDVFTC